MTAYFEKHSQFHPDEALRALNHARALVNDANTSTDDPTR